MTLPAAIPQPPPLPGQTDVTPLVIADLEARRAFGMAKYGTPLTVENGRDHGMDKYQELLDAVVYARCELERMTHLRQRFAETVRTLHALNDAAVEEIADTLSALVLEL